METIKGNIVSISIGGEVIATVPESSLSFTPDTLVIDSYNPVVIRLAHKIEATPENLIGHLGPDNDITFVPREKLSLSDYIFMLNHADQLIGFKIDDKTEYKMWEGA